MSIKGVSKEAKAATKTMNLQAKFDELEKLAVAAEKLAARTVIVAHKARDRADKVKGRLA